MTSDWCCLSGNNYMGSWTVFFTIDERSLFLTFFFFSVFTRCSVSTFKLITADFTF